MCAEVVVVKSVTWPQVVLISVLSLSLLAAVTVLAALGQDVPSILTAILSFLMIIFGALGFNKSQQLDTKMDQVKDLSNGRITQALMENRRLQDQVTALALQVQPKPVADDDDSKV